MCILIVVVISLNHEGKHLIQSKPPPKRRKFVSRFQWSRELAKTGRLRCATLLMQHSMLGFRVVKPPLKREPAHTISALIRNNIFFPTSEALDLRESIQSHPRLPRGRNFIKMGDDFDAIPLISCVALGFNKTICLVPVPQSLEPYGEIVSLFFYTSEDNTNPS